MVEAARKAKGDLKRLETLVSERSRLMPRACRNGRRISPSGGKHATTKSSGGKCAPLCRVGRVLEQYLAPIVPRGEAIRREAMLTMD